jgi:hypothetical protein
VEVAPAVEPFDPEVQELAMSLSQHWQYVGPYRYAVEYNGHILQTGPNPDRADKRRYISIVDRVPTKDAPSWSLNEAKTKAVKAVERAAAAKKIDKVFGRRPTAQAAPFPTDAPQPAPITAADLGADPLLADLPPCEPAPLQQPDPEPAPAETRAQEPAPAPQMVEHTGPVETLPALSATRPDGLRAVFTVECDGHDIIAALNALQSAADLLRSLGHVDCQIDLPAKISL